MADVYIISAASGAGKTSLVKALLGSVTDLAVSVSHTTRPPRPGEVDGQHYHYVTEVAFQDLLKAGAFLEQARVFGNWYGTSRQAVQDRLDANRDVVLEIDWQGAYQVRAAFPNAVTIFILPPSREALEQRLRGRGQDSDSVIANRMTQAQAEMTHWDSFDYTVINDDFATALEDIKAIIRCHRLQRTRQIQGLMPLLTRLLA